MANQGGVVRIYANQLFFTIERKSGLLYTLQSKRWTRKLEQIFLSTVLGVVGAIKANGYDPKDKSILSQTVLTSLDNYL